MEALSTSSSTIGMMQEFDIVLIEAIENFLKGDQNCNFLSEVKNIDLNITIRQKYPILMKNNRSSCRCGWKPGNTFQVGFHKKKVSRNML